jgi:DNA-directed RNA polymerase subunit RPC12/RpoP
MEKIVIKECKKHGLTEYVLRSDGRYRCKKCSVEAVQRRREKLKLLAIEYKGGECEICGYKRCVSALEFHHLDPNEKEFGVGEKGYTRSIETIKKELDICILVCSNCHREIHEGLIDLDDINKGA